MSDEKEVLDLELTRLLQRTDAPSSADAPVRSELTPLVEAGTRLHQLAGRRPRVAERAFAWRPRIARRPAAALAFAVALVALGTTSVFASSGALPDSPLYGERNLGEGLQLRLAHTAQERAALNARFAAVRVSQLHARVQNHVALAGDALTVLLADITSRMRAATHEARVADRGTRDQIQQAEGQIERELNQIQHEGDLPANQGQSISNTVKSLQTDKNTGQSGENVSGGQSNN